MKDQSKGGFLTGKKVIVLGGSSGIGLATAKAAASEGADVVIVSSNKERIKEALAQSPQISAGYAINLTAEESIKDFFSTQGKFDHMVFTAGESLQLGNISTIEIADARQYFNLRYWGAVTAVKYAAPNINTNGSIVLTSGIAGTRPTTGWSIGASICSAMEGFTRAMAIELAPIRVNIVSPGIVKTNLWSDMNEADREGLYNHIQNILPVKKIVGPEEIAFSYLYLMQQPYTTGQTLITDGGMVLV